MPYLSVVDVDDRFVEKVWAKIENVGSFHSIGDGSSKEVLRKVYFESAMVFESPHCVIRMDLHSDYAELHPMVFAAAFFHHAAEVLREISSFSLFAGKPIRCIIPDGSRGARKLARVAGMTEVGKMIRSLSGVAIPCTIFSWR